MPVNYQQLAQNTSLAGFQPAGNVFGVLASILRGAVSGYAGRQAQENRAQAFQQLNQANPIEGLRGLEDNFYASQLAASLQRQRRQNRPDPVQLTDLPTSFQEFRLGQQFPGFASTLREEKDIPAKADLYQRARSQGYTGSLVDFLQLGDRGPEINIDATRDLSRRERVSQALGQPPEGMRRVFQDEGGFRLEPVAGSDIALERQQVSQEEAKNLRQSQMKAAFSQSMILNAIDNLQQNIAEGDYSIAEISTLSAQSLIPGTDAADLQETLEALRANITLESLGNLPVSLVPFSDRDAITLANAKGSLSLNQSPAQMLETLKDMFNSYDRLLGNEDVTFETAVSTQQDVRERVLERERAMRAPLPEPQALPAATSQIINTATGANGVRYGLTADGNIVRLED